MEEAPVASKAIVGEKVGMTQIWDDQHRSVPVTVLRVSPVRIVQVKTEEQEGYTALQVTWGHRRASTLNKPERGHYDAAGVDAGRRLVELRIDDTSAYEVGQELTADIMQPGELVDATAVSKGKGFAGGMKRHNFKGQGASHGNHKMHRAPGSIGACATPSRVFKGTKMAGHMGRSAGHHPQPRDRPIRPRAPAHLGQGGRARAPGRDGRAARRGQGASREGRWWLVTSTADVIETADAGPAAARRLARPEPITRTATRRSMDGTELGGVELDPEIFGIEPNEAVLHQVVTAQLAAARAGTQSTKTRAEVRGGGAKPYRQKGTGRARQGSTRSPQFIGGGVALGPKPRSYAQKTPKKMVRLALNSALSDRAARNRVVVIDAWSFDVPRTKDAIAVLEAFGIRGRVLLVLGDGDGFAERSFANLQEVRSITAGELSAYEILVNDWVVFSDETLPGTANRVAKADTAEAAEDTAEADSGADDTDSGTNDESDDTEDGDAGSDEAATDEEAS